VRAYRGHSIFKVPKIYSMHMRDQVHKSTSDRGYPWMARCEGLALVSVTDDLASKEKLQPVQNLSCLRLEWDVYCIKHVVSTCFGIAIAIPQDELDLQQVVHHHHNQYCITTVDISD
jgi:hypothetical protein